MTNPTVGFIGLGIMGKPMARNLLKAGYTLVIHNRSRAAVDELNKEGAQVAANAQELVSRIEVVITMLPDSPAASRHGFISAKGGSASGRAFASEGLLQGHRQSVNNPG